MPEVGPQESAAMPIFMTGGRSVTCPIHLPQGSEQDGPGADTCAAGRDHAGGSSFRCNHTMNA